MVTNSLSCFVVRRDYFVRKGEFLEAERQYKEEKTKTTEGTCIII